MQIRWRELTDEEDIQNGLAVRGEYRTVMCVLEVLQPTEGADGTWEKIEIRKP